MMEHENTKEARRKLQEYKQKLGKTRAFSSAKFQPRFLLEHSDDVKDRLCFLFFFFVFIFLFLVVLEFRCSGIKSAS